MRAADWTLIDGDVFEEIEELAKKADSLMMTCRMKTNEIRKDFSVSETEKDKLLIEDVQKNLMEVRNAFCEVPYLRDIKDPFELPVQIGETKLRFEFHLYDNPSEFVTVKGVVPKEKPFCESWHITGDSATFDSNFRSGIDHGLETAKFISEHWYTIREEIISEAKGKINNDIKALRDTIAVKDAYLEAAKEGEEEKEL
ncbi:MAG: hypothetical protein IKN07_03645 [Lachnospiraceae bacterium]|nr:hypothetical protein [Lachnospiraceae bacterium]